jgi:hypothetical protein
MTEISRFWDGTTVGDAIESPYDAPTEFSKVLAAVSGTSRRTNTGGVFFGVLNSLACSSPGANTVRVASGEGMCYGAWYQSDANIDTTVSTPVSATRVDRMVLRKTWSTQQVRVARVIGTEGGGTPALTQNVGTVWESPLCLASITTGGVITITDQREPAGDGTQTQSAKGTTSGPTTTSNSYVDMPDMSVTITTSGGDVTVAFSGAFTLATAGDIKTLLVCITGGVIPNNHEYITTVGAGGYAVHSHLQTFPALAAGTYTFKINWAGNGSTLTNVGYSRQLTVTETRR